MKQADLHVGNEYAFPTHKPYDAAPLAVRVRVVSIDGGGKVTVGVVDAGATPPTNAWGTRPVKRHEQRQVATRDIACPWEQWADRAASIGAQQQALVAERRAWHDDAERRRADRLVGDALRALPDEYDEDHFYEETDAEERAALSSAYITARGLGSYATPDKLKPTGGGPPRPGSAGYPRGRQTRSARAARHCGCHLHSGGTASRDRSCRNKRLARACTR